MLKIQEQDDEDEIEDLFENGNAVSTNDVARWRCIGENEARAWAEQIGVSKVGAAFAWTRDDVQDLLDQLDACDDESAAECPAPDDDDDAEEAAEDDEEDD